MASSTRVCCAPANKRTGAAMASPAFQGAACADEPPLPIPGANDSISTGQRLYSLVQCHMKARLDPKYADVDRDRLSMEAWSLLQSISEEELEAMPLRDVVEIVVAYNHFCGTWANGLNGPARAYRDEPSPGQAATSSSQLAVEKRPLDYPIIERPDLAPGNGETTFNKAQAAAPQIVREVPVKRASPLDEILEF
ncbi:hypothetical_protein [Leishmania braziliensis MHOM/BR/75/M2904]|uniref:Hypothetical_protein n=1 Tax=Leishmania braziliensis MHOM/BR/75/M2904 TaxID=420245 RepID=A0A3P3ZCX5_LEIBR|nr:hypothetical_protein [Leishmania braziliensis MHOM/BR/75/M2904]